MKYITLSTDPSSYGSEFNPDDLKPLNARIRRGAEAAGVTVFEGTPHDGAEIEDDPGNEEIDWFSHWCAAPPRYSWIQWAAWFRKQAAK